MTLDPTKIPWHQQPTETEKPYYYFERYRDLGPLRSLKLLHAELSKESDKPVEKSTLSTYSIKGLWVSRSHAYDIFMSQLALTSKVENIQEMERRHTLASKVIQETGIQILNELQEADPKELPLNSQTYILLSTTKAIEGGVRMERLSMGEHTDKTKTVDEGLNKLLDVVNKSKAKVEKARKKESLEDPTIIDAEYIKKE